MKPSFVRSALSTVALAALMAACGGDSNTEASMAESFVAQIATSGALAADSRKRALSASELPVDATAAFDWAEYAHPDLFPKLPAPFNFTLPYLGDVYTVRGYGNGNYLGVTSGNDVYGLGPFTNGELVRLGSLAEFADQIRADACKVYVGSCDADRAKKLFDWAEYAYPAFFPAGPQDTDVVLDGVAFVERVYANGSILRMAKGAEDPEVFGLGTFTDNVLMPIGKWSDFATLVEADACNVYPGSCGEPPPVGALNECTDPATASLPTGFTTTLVYQYSGSLTGEQTVETLINGPSTFEGQEAIKITSTTSGTNFFEGLPVTTSTKIETFEQLGANGVTKTLGALVDVSIDVSPFPVSSSKTVYSPPRDNLLFHIALLQSGTTVSQSTTTTTAPPGLPPVVSTTSETFTFEAKEPVTVFGKTYDTCRYRIDGENASTYTTTWYILGKGIPVKILSTDGVTSELQELKSGTYNGAPL